MSIYLRRLVWFYLPAVLLVCVVTSACQAPSKCCSLEYGLIQPADLDGKWELFDDPLQLVRPEPTMTEQPTETLERNVVEFFDGTRERIKIDTIHQLRRFNTNAPALGEWNWQVDKHTTGGPPFDPGTNSVGQFSRTRCFLSNPSKPEDSLLICVAEIQYAHIISMIFFYFNDSTTSSTDISSLINQALSKTDARIQDIERSLSESPK